MKNTIAFALTAFLALQVSASEAAKHKAGIAGMSEKELIETARGGAPPHISDNAAVMIPGPDGKLKKATEGTNGFTCIPDIAGQEVPDPFCGDKHAMRWVMDLMEGKDAPTNTGPGVAYMAKGGWHWEKGGQILFDKNTPGAKKAKEPPHWMIFWPLNHKMTMLPVVPGEFGTYIMWDDTPYAHLMIYQDPAKLGK